MSILALIKDVRLAASDRRNDARRELWRSFYARERPEVIPLVVAGELPFWAANFGLDLTDCFTSAERYVESILTVKLLHWETFDDDTLLTPGLEVSFGTGFDPALFGCEMVLRPDDYPIPGQPIIRDWADLKHLGYPSFYDSSVMRRYHAFYGEVEAVVGAGISVGFQEWLRGPWGLAWSLRGFENLMLDLHDDPARIHQLSTFLAESRIRWTADRTEYLQRHAHERVGASPPPGQMIVSDAVGRPATYGGSESFIAHDEVDGNILSRQLYREFILPYEARVSSTLRRVYYHSCGNMVPFLGDLANLPNLLLLHVSARTDLELTVKALGDRFFYQKCLNPAAEVVLLDAEQVEENLRHLVTVSEGTSRYLCADGIGAMPGALAKTREWLSIAREVAGRGGGG